MSKVQLQGNASGTGIFTIASPNSNTDRTLTLPDSTGTLLNNSAQGIPRSALPAGSILQVVNVTYDPGSQNTTSTDFASTGLAASITPTTSTSKILVMFCFWECYTSGSSVAISFELRRGASGVGDFGNATIGYYGNTSNNYFNVNGHYVDSPATTSSTTYTMYWKSRYGTSVGINTDNTQSIMTLMEIAA